MAEVGVTEPNFAKTPLFQATHSARYGRQDLIKRIQKATGRRLVCYVSGDGCRIDRDDTVGFVDILHHVPNNENLDLLLHTSGGDVDVAEKLISIVRRRVGTAELQIVVPDYAKSAGTLMVLGADRVLMSDTSELGPIDPQILFPDSTGHYVWRSVQNYLDAYDEHSAILKGDPANAVSRVMLGKLDPTTVKWCQAVKDRARHAAENLLKRGMFRNGGPWTMTPIELLDTSRWQSHSQMISWEDAQDPRIGLRVEYLDPRSANWQLFWRLYCLQRLAIKDGQKLYESEHASLPIDGRRS
ncbi:MAG: hypothetical protein OXI56_00335 [bacterium]|nr:hypothetical protein [bacterium]